MLYCARDIPKSLTMSGRNRLMQLTKMVQHVAMITKPEATTSQSGKNLRC